MGQWQDWQQPLVTWGVPLFLLAVALWLWWPTLRRRLAARRLRRSLRRAGRANLEQVVLSDGLDGEVFIDHLVLTPRGIHVIRIQHYQGAVFAAEGMDSWSQVVGQRTYRFPNPLPELERSVMAVRQAVGDVPVTGHLLVTAKASFPKGRPVQVRMVERELRFDEAGADESVSPALRHAWQALRHAVRPLDRQQRRLLSAEETPADGVRDGFIALVLTALAVAWLVWRLQLLPG